MRKGRKNQGKGTDSKITRAGRERRQEQGDGILNILGFGSLIPAFWNILPLVDPYEGLADAMF